MAPGPKYIAYIKSDKWKAKRQQVFAHYGKKCYACGARDKVLHCHHMTYARLGREAMGDLIPLCVPCHKEVTALYKRNRRRGLMRVTLEFVKMKKSRRK